MSRHDNNRADEVFKIHRCFSGMSSPHDHPLAADKLLGEAIACLTHGQHEGQSDASDVSFG